VDAGEGVALIVLGVLAAGVGAVTSFRGAASRIMTAAVFVALAVVFVVFFNAKAWDCGVSCSAEQGASRIAFLVLFALATVLLGVALVVRLTRTARGRERGRLGVPRDVEHP